jgi:hypothetical protein
MKRHPNEELILRLKSRIVTGSGTNVTNFINTPQRLLQRHRLVPLAPAEPLESLLKREFGASSIEEAANKLTLKKIGLIVMYKIVKNPVDYNIFPLLNADPDAVNKKTGLNTRRLEVFSTMFRLNSTSEPDRIDILPPGCNNYYILETLDGNTFKLLGYAKPASTLDKLAPGFLSGVMSESLSPSRSTRYVNRILEDEILRHIGVPLKLSELTEKRAWRSNINRIAEICKNRFERKLDAILASGGGRLDYTSVKALILKSQYVILDSIMSMLGTRYEEIVEVYLSAASEYDKISNRIKNDLKNTIDEYDAQLRNATQASDFAKTSVINIYEKLIRKLLEKYITDKSSILLLAEQKQRLLAHFPMK